MKLSEYRLCLEKLLAKCEPPTGRPIHSLDQFLASALIQKALRRGDRYYATGAAETLCKIDPARLWRRLVVIAYEDFGLADLDLVCQVTAAASDKLWRNKVGGDRVVLSYLIERLLQCPRDRRLDDAYMLAVSLEEIRNPSDHLKSLRMSKNLAQVITSAVEIVRSCERLVTPRQFRAIIPVRCEALLLTMEKAGTVDEDFRNVLQQAYRTSRCLLPVLLPLLRSAGGTGRPVVQGNPVPPVTRIGEIPSYALDGYTWLGRIALGRLYRRLPKLARLLRDIPTQALRTKALVNILFAVEGGICTLEIHDRFQQELRAHALGCWSGLSHSVLMEAIDTMRDAIPLLNGIRSELVSEIQKPTQLELWNAK